MAGPYIERPVPGRSLLKRLLRRPRTEGVRVEVVNLLARAERLPDISHSQLRQIEDRYDVDLRLSFVLDLQRWFKQYLTYCLDDDHMTDDEVADLVHLKTLFGLSDRDARRFHDEAASGSYRRAIGERLEDGSLSKDETAFVEALRSKLLLSDEYADRLRSAAGAEVFQRAELLATTDVRLAPGEDAELNALAESLGIDRGQATANPALLERLRLYWTIENGELPIATVAINLPRGERAHLQVSGAQWHEYRTQTRQVGFQRRTNHIIDATPAGVSLQFALGGDAEAVELRTVTSEELTHLDTGVLYVTNRRLILDGPQLNKSIALNEILTFGLLPDGLSIELAEGRPIILRVSAQLDTINLLLTRLIREANAEPSNSPSEA